jgi:hypothetical protein
MFVSCGDDVAGGPAQDDIIKSAVRAVAARRVTGRSRSSSVGVF